MKKVTLANTDSEVINFLIRGRRHGNDAVEVTIDSKGVVVSDTDAVVIKERLGGLVNISDVKSDDLVKKAKEVVEGSKKGKSSKDEEEVVEGSKDEEEVK